MRDVAVVATLLRTYSTSGMVDLLLDDGRFLTLEASTGRFRGLAGAHGTAIVESGGGGLDHFMRLVDFQPDGDARPTPAADHFPPMT